MKTRYVILLALGLALAFAQSNKSRIIKVEAPEGKVSGNIRNGPLTFESGKVGGVVGKVKDLTILSTKAVLTAPDGKSIQDEGERTAAFDGSVQVKRDRMTANGPKLTYREATGLGVLEGASTMRQEPKDGKGDVVEVAAPKMTFEVDTNISTSSGGVTLKNGRQEGRSESVYYEEDRSLAIFNDDKEVVLTRKRDDGDLVIRAKEIRSLTDDKRLWAFGGITLIDGDLTTTGDAVLYNDKTGIAIIIGKPARSENAKEKFKVSGGTLLHDVNKHRVVGLSQNFKIPEADFQKATK